MARVTVEDCVTKVRNRFELVMLATQRARSIAAGADLTLERDNDKNPVVALREIADETIDLEELKEGLVKSLQKHVETDEPEEDEVDLLAIQQEVSAVAGESAQPADDGAAGKPAVEDAAAAVDGGVTAETPPQDDTEKRAEGEDTGGTETESKEA